MDISLSLIEIAKACKGEVISPINIDNIRVDSISTDSRKNVFGDLFIALVGEKFDAHEYIDKVIAEEVLAIVVSDKNRAAEWGVALPVVLVEDTNQALLDIARLYREKLDTKIIAIAGSVGKTSTKDTIAQALSVGNKVYKTEQNLNNNFGVAYTLLDVPSDSDFAVVELGMDGLGQIEIIANASRPDFGVITNIGTSHIELLGNRRNILHAKAELLEGIKDGAPLILNAEDPYLLALAKAEQANRPIILVDTSGLSARLRSVLAEDSGLDSNGEDNIAELSEILSSYTGPDSLGSINSLDSLDSFVASDKGNQAETVSGTRYKADNIKANQDGLSFTVYKGIGSDLEELVEMQVRVFGPQIVENLLYGLAIADLTGQDLSLIAKDIAQSLKVSKSRQELIKLDNDILLIDDSYNASPESMKSAFALTEMLTEHMGYEQKIGVIGGINELGDYSEALHADVAKALAEADFDQVALIGPQAENMKLVISGKSPQTATKIFKDNQEIIEWLDTLDYKNTIILVKGSRGFALDEVVTALKENG